MPHECRVVSAHRTPAWMAEYAAGAEERGLEVIVAGAGGAAHLPGMVAAQTVLPVLGVPVQSRALNGLDSLLSIVQMPGGVPVGTLAIGKAGAKNAALLAAAILANAGRSCGRACAFRAEQEAKVRADRLPPDGPESGSEADPAGPGRPLLPGATIGVLGSGQLGRMLALAARPMGYRVHVLSPGTTPPPARPRTGRWTPTTWTSTRCAPSPPGRRGDLRVRERARRVRRGRRREGAGAPGPPGAPHRPEPAPREALPLRRRLPGGAVRGGPQPGRARSGAGARRTAASARPRCSRPPAGATTARARR